MEDYKSQEQFHDGWREAILAERKSQGIHTEMIRGLHYLEGESQNALILGDASLVQSNYLIETAGFSHVTDVDSSPSIFDEIPDIDSEKLERIQSSFEEYNPPADTFDYIYGKSIAFNPKETLPLLLTRLNRSLRQNGVFSAVYAAKGDSFRPYHYSERELEKYYKNSGLRIVDLNHPKALPTQGLIRPGIAHTIDVIAKKK